MGNVRGNHYSRAHTMLLPTERAFWRFSFDEMVEHDLPGVLCVGWQSVRL